MYNLPLTKQNELRSTFKKKQTSTASENIASRNEDKLNKTLQRAHLNNVPCEQCPF